MHINRSDVRTDESNLDIRVFLWLFLKIEAKTGA